jgi:hypothetical protein
MNSETKLNDLTSYSHYVIGHNISKNANGFALDSTYYKKYYSMISTEIYFGDTYVEDAHDVQWVIRQQQQPLFGYNSYLFDEVAMGARMVTGMFNVNFSGAKVMDTLIAAAKTGTAYPASYTITKTGEEGKISERFSSEQISSDYYPDKEPIWKPFFDLDIVCMGDKKKGKPAHIVIEDVNISSCGTAISAAGGVLMQQYNFIGRDIRTIE